MGVDPKGVVLASEFDRTFSVGEEKHGVISPRLGSGLYETLDHRIAVHPRWVATRWDRMLAVMALVLAAGLGWVAAELVDGLRDWTLLIIVAIVAFVVGWWLSRWDPHDV